MTKLCTLDHWKKWWQRKSNNNGIRTHNWTFHRYRRLHRDFRRSEKNASLMIQWILWMPTCCRCGILTIWPALVNYFANHRFLVILMMNMKCDVFIQWFTMFIGVSCLKVLSNIIQLQLVSSFIQLQSLDVAIRKNVIVIFMNCAIFIMSFEIKWQYYCFLFCFVWFLDSSLLSKSSVFPCFVLILNIHFQFFWPFVCASYCSYFCISKHFLYFCWFFLVSLLVFLRLAPCFWQCQTRTEPPG